MTEDPRKAALKRGLRQLTDEQIRRVVDHPGEMVLDEVNYADGRYCPLAVGLGLDRAFKSPTNEKVFAVLVLLGYSVFNTRGVAGDFYRADRKADLLTAAGEVLAERAAGRSERSL